MLGAKEMIRMGAEDKITARPRESWNTPACEDRGEERKTPTNTILRQNLVITVCPCLCHAHFKKNP